LLRRMRCARPDGGWNLPWIRCRPRQAGLRRGDGRRRVLARL